MANDAMNGHSRVMTATEDGRNYVADQGFKLPFKDRPVRPYLKRAGDGVRLDFNAYLQTLLQGAGVSLKAEHATLVQETKNVDERQLFHGKDCIAILCALLKTDDFKEAAVEPREPNPLHYRLPLLISWARIAP